MSTAISPNTDVARPETILESQSTKLDLPRPSRRNPPRGRKWIGLTVGLAIIGVIVYYAWTPLIAGTSRTDHPLSVPVSRATLRIVVSERGNLESCVTVDGICELIGHQNKIIQLTPEGSRVEKGQLVCRFDSGELDKNIAQQEIKFKQAQSKIETSKQEVEIHRSKGESEIIDASVELTLAVLDLEKYQQGDYKVEIDDINGSIALARKDLEKAADLHEQFKALLKKGFKSPQDLRAVEQQHTQAEFVLKRDVQKLMVKKDYEYKRKTTEYTGKVDSAKKKVERSKATAIAELAKANSEFLSAKSTSTIEEQQLKEFLRQKEKCEINAKQAGIVAYANEPYYDSSRQIREGAMVYSRQKIFSLPDMSNMQVKVSIHESMVKKIKPGLKAEIRIDAFPNVVIIGTVKTVSQLADSNRGWMSGGVKEYPSTVTIDTMPKDDLRPGMTAEVKILVNELDDVLIVPIQAVVERKGEYYVYIEGPTGIERRKVKPGETNEKHVEILDGVKENERVALDARARLAAEVKTEEAKDVPGSSKSSPVKPVKVPTP